MTFLTPVFLGALALAAVPVIIHMLTRMRRRTVVLPTLKFLRRAETTTSRSRKIRDILLLILRTATVAALVIAFARPTTLSRAAALIAPADTRRLVLLVDRSASMGYIESGSASPTPQVPMSPTSAGKTAHQKERLVIDSAKAEAIRLIRSADRGTRFTVIAYDDAPEVLASDVDLSEAEKSVAAVAVTARGTNAVLALKAASEIPAPRTVILLSDMARGSFHGIKSANLGSIGPDLRFVDLSKPDRWNRRITAVRAANSRSRDKFPEAEIDIRATPGAPEAALQITGGDKPQEEILVTDQILAAGSIKVRLPASERPAVTFRLTPDALPIDDVRYAVIRPDAAVRAGYIAGKSDRAVEYLKAVGGGMEWQAVTGPDDLEHIDALVVAGGKVDPGIVRRLPTFIRGGGTLLVFGPAAAEISDFLPVQIGRRDESVKPLYIEETERPIMEGLTSETRRAPAAFTRLNVAMLQYDPSATSAAEILAQFEDGRPYIVSERRNQGRVIFWNASADASWGDLPVHSLFPILLVRLIRQAEQSRTEGIRVGEDLRFPARPGIYRFENQIFAVNVDPNEGDIDPVSSGEILSQLGGERSRVEKAGGDIGSLINDAPPDPQRLWRFLILAALILAIGEILAGRPVRAA